MALNILLLGSGALLLAIGILMLGYACGVRNEREVSARAIEQLLSDLGDDARNEAWSVIYAQVDAFKRREREIEDLKRMMNK